MDPERFDGLVRSLAHGNSRRQVLIGLAGAALAQLGAMTAGRTSAAAAGPHAPGPFCPGTKRCLALAFDLETGTISEGSCPDGCSAKVKAVRASMSPAWQSLARYLTRRGYRPVRRTGRPLTLFLETSDGAPFGQKTIVTYKGGPGDNAHLVLSHFEGSDRNNIYAIIHPFKRNSRLVLSENGRIGVVRWQEVADALHAPPATANLGPSRLGMDRQLSAQEIGSGMVSTVWCTSAYERACNLTAELSCEQLFGELFGLALKGATRFARLVPDLDTAFEAWSLVLDDLSRRIATKFRFSDEFVSVVRETLNDLASEKVQNELIQLDLCGAANSAVLCGSTDPFALFSACCQASSGGACGTSVCCHNSWGCAASPIGVNFCSCASGTTTGSGICCDDGETACLSACVPAGLCCPEDRCADGSCPDATGACGDAGGPCGLVTCDPGRVCCRGSIADVCIPAGWDCCSTGGGCPPGSHCCDRNGAVGCCLG